MSVINSFASVDRPPKTMTQLSIDIIGKREAAILLGRSASYITRTYHQFRAFLTPDQVDAVVKECDRLGYPVNAAQMLDEMTARREARHERMSKAARLRMKKPGFLEAQKARMNAAREQRRVNLSRSSE